MSMKKQSETQRHNMNFKELVGKRIKLLSMPNDPDPIPIGSEGLVEMVGSEFDNTTQIFVKWDNGRSLILLGGLDEFQVLDEC